MILFFADNLSGWFSAIYFKFISKYVVYYELIGIVMILASLILHVIFISEFPIWEVKSGLIMEGIEYLKYILETNSVDDCEDEIEDL